MNRVGPGGHPKCMPGSQVSSKLTFELLALLTENEPAAVEHSLNRGVHFRPKRQVLAAQIAEGNFYSRYQLRFSL